jgi:hypothetical protein
MKQMREQKSGRASSYDSDLSLHLVHPWSFSRACASNGWRWLAI